MKRGSRQGDGQKECGQGKKSAERVLHSEKKVLESRRNAAERKETTRAKIICKVVRQSMSRNIQKNERQ